MIIYVSYSTYFYPAKLYIIDIQYLSNLSVYPSMSCPENIEDIMSFPLKVNSRTVNKKMPIGGKPHAI